MVLSPFFFHRPRLDSDWRDPFLPGTVAKWRHFHDFLVVLKVLHRGSDFPAGGKHGPGDKQRKTLTEWAGDPEKKSKKSPKKLLLGGLSYLVSLSNWHLYRRFVHGMIGRNHSGGPLLRNCWFLVHPVFTPVDPPCLCTAGCPPSCHWAWEDRQRHIWVHCCPCRM